MIKVKVIIGILMAIALFGLPAGVQAQSEENKVYANAVIDFHIGGSENLQDDPNDAIGPVNKEQACRTTNKGFVSLGGGYIVLDMGENGVILDETGNDLTIFEVGDDYYSCGKPEDYEVYVNEDLDTWNFVGNGRGTTEFDISSVGLKWARYVKIVDATGDIGGKTPGVDIDAVKALHFGEPLPPLSLTKSASPYSIKQDQTTTVTLTVKNTGTSEITDIEVSDTIPSDLTFVSGETSKRYASLRPKDLREFQYILQLNEAGTFNLDPATATYADEEGNYHTVESKTTAIEVIPSLITTPVQTPTPHTTKNPSTDISTASVHLHGEKTDVVLGEDVLLKLSAVNIIGNPLMHVQVIIIPPSGWSVTSSEFAKSGAGQYTTTYDIESGVGRDIEVRIMPNQIGDGFQVQGRIIYYFGDDSDAREDHTLTLPITVRAEADKTPTPTQTEQHGETPGFGVAFALGSIVLIWYLGSQKWK
ncbi:MAG: hypothetical protein AEth_01725 [Candidatus Argoarchaeum ethanivorans]|uniref:DUF11 domain-containing protein n=1 Tax=Candidatus Argoarchaeum ethanivorans TaxID=2608793 RepID=A0A8B3RZB5_9EURY|nr:MAG: hypothetical protein AEth_01725 [Candidatus Argoarchaeum ethanivorans]